MNIYFNFTGKLIFRVHAAQRMFSRGISKIDVSRVLKQGTVIEEYLNDKPYPSYLVLGVSGKRPLHVVVAVDKTENRMIIITVYEPNPNLWSPGFKMRRGK